MTEETYFENWVETELGNYDTRNKTFLKKGYLHFDRRIWFPDRQELYKKFFQNPQNVISHSFYPFLKVNIKTPRYKWDDEKGKRVIKYKKRPIAYSAHGDALILSYYASVLNTHYEEYLKKIGLKDCVLAYRTLDGKCNIDYAKEVFEYIASKGECTAIALDIKGFFDNLDHKILRQNWLSVIGEEKLPEDQYKIFRSVTKYSYVNRSTLLKHLGMNLKKLKRLPPRICEPEQFREIREEKNIIATNKNSFGIPQGSPISAVLSNIYMLELDKTMYDLSLKNNFLYRRYCDDIIIVGDTSKIEQIKKLVYEAIEKVKLKIQPDKEEIILFQSDTNGVLRAYDVKSGKDFTKKNLQYLGFEFNGKDAYIRSSSLSRYYRRMKSKASQVVKEAYAKEDGGVIIHKQRFYHKFSFLGKTNFISYAKRSAETFQSETIRKQVARHFKKMKKALTHFATKRAEKKT